MEQHRISKVYWKQFSFKKNNADTICYLDFAAKNPVIQYKHIKKFTVETDLFDTNIADPGHERYFETLSSKIETYYPAIIKQLNESGSLTEKARHHLNHFIANIFVRQESTREFIKLLLHSQLTREKFYNEITLFKEGKNKEETLFYFRVIAYENPDLNEHINILSGEIWHHLQTIFQYFNHVFIKAPKGRWWFSTDNPIYVDNGNSNEAWMIAKEGEIYFPISKDFLVFMFRPDAKTNNSLRNRPVNKTILATKRLHSKIIKEKIQQSILKYLVLAENYIGTDISKV